MTIFHTDADYEAFERLLCEGLEKFPVDLIAYQWMRNHWHMVISPREDGAMSRLMYWVTMTHTARHHAYYHCAGSGHLYQGRYKSFPIQSDEHFFVVCRYVERNALAAGLVDAAEQWARPEVCTVIAVASAALNWPAGHYHACQIGLKGGTAQAEHALLRSGGIDIGIRDWESSPPAGDCRFAAAVHWHCTRGDLHAALNSDGSRDFVDNLCSADCQSGSRWWSGERCRRLETPLR